MPSLFRARRALLALAASMLISVMAAPAQAAIPAPPGGPILVVTTSGVATSSYYPEILRAEGLNEFDVKSPAALTAATLAGYDTVVLAGSVTSAQADALTAWVTAGGNLVAMRPGPQLASLLGLTAAGGTLSNGYLKVDTGSAPGTGIVGETIQYHGAADRYTLTGGARAVATLYSNATTATSNPAVTQRDVGSGHATAFVYDVAQSIYLTRQGNPAWVGQDHDSDGLTRAVDMFQAPSGGTDWLNRSKIAIPQADEQQRLLANAIVQLGASPLPRFWYLPRGDKAEVVMTGDDHGSGETSRVFDGLMGNDPPGGCTAQELADWECVRATSYAYPDSPIGGETAYQAAGFEIALHLTVDGSSCGDFGSPPALPSLNVELSAQLADFASAFPGVSAPTTIRTHCIPWSDWDTQPKTDLAHGIRMNTDYYWFSNTNWDQDLAGMFSGSGMPMRFAAADGSLIDVYQATTYSADDATADPDHVVPAQMKTLIDNAVGVKGYYGAFSVIVHNDGPQAESAARDQVVAYARSRGVSVISERQLLTWLDGRDSSSFGNVDFGSGALTFTISASSAARGLQAMVPLNGAWGQMQNLTRGGSPVSFDTETIKGVDYALFPAVGGSYRATYSGTHPPQTTITQAPSDDTSTSATIAFSSSASGSTFECKLDGGAFAACTSPKTYTGLALGDHTFLVRATANGVTDPTPASTSWTISAPPPPPGGEEPVDPPASGGGSSGSTSTGSTAGTTAGDSHTGTKAGTAPLPFLTTRASSFRPGGRRAYAFTVRLTDSARLVLRIRDSHGRVVREIRVAKRKTGAVTVRWNGKDSRGRFVSAASYRYTLTAIGSKGYRRTATGRVRVLSAR
jgi:FlgD Ig-like domain